MRGVVGRVRRREYHDLLSRSCRRYDAAIFPIELAIHIRRAAVLETDFIQRFPRHTSICLGVA